jgi:hypothetical protein
MRLGCVGDYAINGYAVGHVNSNSGSRRLRRRGTYLCHGAVGTPQIRAHYVRTVSGQSRGDA